MIDSNIRDVSIVTEHYQDPAESFLDYENIPYSALWYSKTSKDFSGSVIGYTPAYIIEWQQGTIYINKQKSQQILPFWQLQKELLKNNNFHQYSYPINQCGYLGYISYNANQYVERIPMKLKFDYEIPEVVYIIYCNYIYFDKKYKYKIQIKYSQDFYPAFKPYKKQQSFSLGSPICDSEKSEYLQKIEQVQEYIRRGDVYEVNLSRRFCSDFYGSPYQLFLQLYYNNPTPYSVYLDCNSFQIVSNSPELFLKARKNNIETRPIKGTIPRGKDKKQDINNQNKLLQLEKEQAELYMIIDLLRNDLGKVSEWGSVYVQAKKTLETYSHIHHLVAILTAKLSKKYDYIDLLQSCFPGGSITGCPKIRCMEIIDELEVWQRNIYTGTLFIINQEFLQSNIAIRTATIKDQKCYFHSGGAITIDSNPDLEFQETEHKIKQFLQQVNKK